MQSVSDPLNRLYDDAGWFTRATELRLWVIHASGELRKPILKLLPGFEFHHDNHSAWLAIEHAHTRGESGWQLRANQLAAHWDLRIAAFAEEDIELAPIEAVIAPGVSSFAHTCAALLEALDQPLRGLVTILAPTIVDDPLALTTEIASLIEVPTLNRARWILVLDEELELPPQLLDALGSRHSMQTRYGVDEDQKRRDLDAMLAAGESPHFGMAWPAGVSAPPRVDDPPVLPPLERDAMLAAAGVAPALIHQGPRLRAQVMGAAIAMHDGRNADAIALQREAADGCAQLGLHELHVICRVTLASYLSGVNQRPEAKRELELAIETARTHELPRSESQGQLALGLLEALDQQFANAVAAYMASAHAAQLAAEPSMEIEAWRLAGQIAAQHGHERDAAATFGQAIRVASGLEPDAAAQTSASEAARQLAQLYQARGETAQAQSLYAQADALERGAESSHVSE